MRIPRPLIAPPLAALLLGACTTSESDGPGRLATNEDPGYSASGTEVIETGADGLPKYRLRADKVRQDPATGTVALEGVDMSVSRPGTDRWRVQAERGDLPADARRVTLQGDVRLESEGLRIGTATLAYDLQSNRVAAPGEVRFEMAGRTLEADGLEADLDSQQAKLGARVHGRFTP